MSAPVESSATRSGLSNVSTWRCVDLASTNAGTSDRTTRKTSGQNDCRSNTISRRRRVPRNSAHRFRRRIVGDLRRVRRQPDEQYCNPEGMRDRRRTRQKLLPRNATHTLSAVSKLIVTAGTACAPTPFCSQRRSQEAECRKVRRESTADWLSKRNAEVTIRVPFSARVGLPRSNFRSKEPRLTVVQKNIASIVAVLRNSDRNMSLLSAAKQSCFDNASRAKS